METCRQHAPEVTLGFLASRRGVSFGPAMEEDLHPSAPGSPGTRYPRRSFLRLASSCLVCGAAGIPALVHASTGHLIDVGTPADYPKDGISEKHILHDLFVVRQEKRLFAATAICPHKSNALFVSQQDPNLILCSGHQSRFSPDGVPMEGPARRPLVRYAISLNEKGRLVVDKSRQFTKPQWENPASFVALA